MKFESWLKVQIGRNDWVGDLSQDFIHTGEKDFIKAISRHAPCYEAIEALHAAVSEYLLEVKPNPFLKRKALNILHYYPLIEED